jgi:hypothetical protein
MGIGNETAKDRFSDKISKCWIWKGARNRDGYGTFWNGDWVDRKKHRPRIVLAHRWAYEHFVGPITDGLYVLHSCDEPACVNPEHLFLGTQRDNVVDMHNKKRSPQSGESNGNSKLTAVQISEIRARYTGTHGQQTALGKEFGVSQATISKIVGTRKRLPPESWKVDT